jgi:acetyltransferase-like isoleucine patch superfamily enzyme
MPDSPQLAHDWFPRPLPGNIEIGEGTWIDTSYAFLHCHSRRASGVRIGRYSGVYGATMFELGPGGQLEVGDYCALVGAVIRTDQRVVIEDYALIAHDVFIADSWAAYPPARDDSERLPDEPQVSIIIRRNAWIGARAILLGGADIGEGAIVGAGAVVDFAVPENAIVAGNPARIVGSTVHA